MITKADPYATKLHKRVDALLLVFTVLLIALVLRSSANGQGSLPLAFAPKPFWTTLNLFQVEPRLSVVVGGQGAVNQDFGSAAGAQRLDLYRLAGSFRSPNGSATPMMILPEKAQTHAAANDDGASVGYKAASTSQPSLADNWSKGPGVGSTIPAYSTGFGRAANRSSASASSSQHNQSVAGSDVRAGGAIDGTENAATLLSENTRVFLAGPDAVSDAVTTTDAASTSIHASIGAALNLDATNKKGDTTIAGLTTLPDAVLVTKQFDGNGSTSTVWGTTTNWSPDGVPTAADDVLFDNVFRNPLQIFSLVASIEWRIVSRWY